MTDIWVWPKIFFAFTDLIIIIGLHASIWRIGFTRMTVNETIQVANMWQVLVMVFNLLPGKLLPGQKFWWSDLENRLGEQTNISVWFIHASVTAPFFSFLHLCFCYRNYMNNIFLETVCLPTQVKIKTGSQYSLLC